MFLILNVWCFVISKFWFGVILKLVFVICIVACWQHLSCRTYCDNASRLNSALSLRLWIWKLSSWNLKMFVILKLENVVILTLYLLAISKLGILSSPAPCSGSKELKLQQMVVTWACAGSLIPSLLSFAMGRPVIPSSWDKWTTWTRCPSPLRGSGQLVRSALTLLNSSHRSLQVKTDRRCSSRNLKNQNAFSQFGGPPKAADQLPKFHQAACGAYHK